MVLRKGMCVVQLHYTGDTMSNGVACVLKKRSL